MYLNILNRRHILNFSKCGVFSKAKCVIHKVPTTASQDLNFDISGLLEKKDVKISSNSFKIMKKIIEKHILSKNLSKLLKYGLESNVVDFMAFSYFMY